MKEAIEKIKPYVVQIATPYATGTGFYTPAYQKIVTNYHVVQGSRDVVIKSIKGLRYKAKLVYVDQKHDLALLELLDINDMPTEPLKIVQKHTIGDNVIALGHPYGLTFTSTFGIIANTRLEIEGISFLMHDAALNPGNSGGPLINREGAILGVNTSIIKEGKNIGVALKTKSLVNALQQRKETDFPLINICSSCNSIINDTIEAPDSCLSCGTSVHLVSRLPSYKPTGISLNIENILNRLGYDPEVARRGQFCWELIKGSATIMINYHSKSGYILAESILCTIPQSSTLELYTYLLKVNYENKGLTFSVKDNNIILSILIYDQHLHPDTTYQLLHQLIHTSDEYDDLLIEKFNAQWK